MSTVTGRATDGPIGGTGRRSSLWHLLGTVFLILLLTTPGTNAMEPREFATPEEEARFAELTDELRCTVCQNQSLSDSDAPLAQDLRNEIHTMLQQGNSDEDIKRFLVDRYGDFVLYRPPVRGNTLLLWLAPLLLFTTGAAVMAVTIRRHRVMLAQEALDEVEDEMAASSLNLDAPPSRGDIEAPDHPSQPRDPGATSP